MNSVSKIKVLVASHKSSDGSSESVSELDVKQWDVDPVSVVEVSPSLVKQVLVSSQTNARQGTRGVKTKAEVRGGGKKPFKQKGTGKARAGSIRSPIWVGGGVAHGPKAVDYNRKINKTMAKSVVNACLRNALVADNLCAIEWPEDLVSTKTLNALLQKFEVSDIKRKKGARLGLITKTEENKLKLSARNLPSVKLISVERLHVTDFVGVDGIIVSKEAFETISERFFRS